MPINLEFSFGNILMNKESHHFECSSEIELGGLDEHEELEPLIVTFR